MDYLVAGVQESFKTASEAKQVALEIAKREHGPVPIVGILPGLGYGEILFTVRPNGTIQEH